MQLSLEVMDVALGSN
jgi:hypothetical protein